jgi:Phage gp6-like head-tail connector protein
VDTPTLDDVKNWLGLDEDDTQDDVVLTESLNAALAAQGRVVFYPLNDADEEVLTDDLREALFLRTQRLAARRNSPEGVVGLAGTGGDFVSARVPSYDADVTQLEGPYREIPVA